MQVPNMPISKDQQDITEHGSYQFPFEIYENIMSKNLNNTINWHWHDDLQLCYVPRGDISIFLSGSRLDLCEGEGAFINSGFLHMVKPERDPDSIFVCINFSPKLLRLFAGSVCEQKYVTPFLKKPEYHACRFRKETEWESRCLQTIVKMKELYEAKPFGYEYRIVSELFRIWTEIICHYRPEEEQKDLHSMEKGDSAAHQIMAYIHDHYAENITIEKISEEVSFSPGECCRLFKRVTRSTIFSYLRVYRITKSTELLKNTELSISDIAYRCGFSSTSYFIDTFKKSTGMTPLKFRKI